MKQMNGKCVYGIYGHDVKTKNLEISKLHGFQGHPFKVEYDRHLLELAESIREEGILVPLIVRPAPAGPGYEIIAGHRRKAAAKWAGLDAVPAVIVQMDDVEATIAMADSNLHREHIKPSEKAYAYKMKLDVMKRQGKKPVGTLSQLGTKLERDAGENGKPVLRSDKLLARQTGESRNQIVRYIRLTNLIPRILDMVDEGKIAFTIAVELSYLKEAEQYELYAVMDLEQCTPSLSQANRMKRLSQSEGIDMDTMYDILGEEKANQKEQIKVRADVLSQYFPADFTPRQKVELIERLVKEWYERRENIPIGKMGKHDVAD